MRRTVFTDLEFQPTGEGYLVDNGPWQEEIRRRVEAEPRGTVGDLEAFEAPPVEGPAVTIEPKVGTTIDPRVVYEELIEKARREAETLKERASQEARESAEAVARTIREGAEREAVEVRTRIEMEARAAAEEARRKAEEEGRARGFDEGKAQGFVAGDAAGRQAHEGKIREWDGLLASALRERRQALGDLEEVLVDLVGVALAKCLRKEAVERPAMVVEMAAHALERAQDRVRLRIHLNPEDVERVHVEKDRLQLSVGTGALELVADGRVEKGGCLVETEAGSVDARLGTLVTQTQDALRGGN
jgi:flagellar assembly protein FliH